MCQERYDRKNNLPGLRIYLWRQSRRSRRVQAQLPAGKIAGKIIAKRLAVTKPRANRLGWMRRRSRPCTASTQPSCGGFLVGVLRDESLAVDAMQVAFVRAMEVGHTTGEESRKSWLFRVAYNEALAVRRREATGKRIAASLSHPSGGTTETDPVTQLVTQEEIERVRLAIGNLSLEQEQIVRKRIYDGMTFAEVAKQLGIPLGTALTRMRTALAKLREALRDL